MEQRRKNAVGAEIRRLRDSKGWTQEVLAARCAVSGYEVSRSTLAKIEAQIRGISDVEMFVLAKVLGVSLSDLFPVGFQARLRRGDYARVFE